MIEVSYEDTIGKSYFRGEMARLNVELDSTLLSEAQELSGAASKREAIETALRAFVRHHRLAGLIERAGAVPLAFTVDGLLGMREEE